MILIIKPCFSTGNIGDNALITTIKNIYNNKNIVIPNNRKELKLINCNNIDCLIYFGNDCVAYYYDAIPKENINKCLSLNKPVHIINTSWGENVNSQNIKYIKSISKDNNFHIYIRDIYSYQLIQKDINFYNKPILTADLAILCKINNIKFKNNKLEEWITKSSKPIIGINTHNDFKEYNFNVNQSLINFINNNSINYRFLFIPHDSRKKEYENLNELNNKCNNIDSFVVNYLDPEYEKYITSKLYLVITGRMHLSILTIPNGIPSIAIAYNGVKAKGTFKHWNLENLVIEPKDIKELQHLLLYIENNYLDLVKKIYDSQEIVNTLVKKQII